MAIGTLNGEIVVMDHKENRVLVEDPRFAPDNGDTVLGIVWCAPPQPQPQAGVVCE